jgi:hypothetical protein
LWASSVSRSSTWARQQLAQLEGERYAPEAELVERLREGERERSNYKS